MEATILSKVLLVLSNTKYALLQDLEREFVSIRGQAEKAGSDFEAAEVFVEAVFARIGFDISHIEETRELKDLLKGLFKLMDGLDEQVKELSSGSDPDWMKIAEKLMKTVKEVVGLVKSFEKIEFEKAMKELSETAAPDKLKETAVQMGKRLSDHILITLLRNTRTVFADEISYCEQLASGVRKQLRQDASQLTENARLLLTEAAQRAEEAERRLGDEVDWLKSEIEKGMDPEFFRKVSRSVNGIYAVLDLLGLIGTTTIRLKVPQKAIAALNNLQKNAENLPQELQLSADVLGVSPANLLLQAKKQTSQLSYPITIDIIHWDKLNDLFTRPIDYLKGLYQVDSYAQAEQLLTRIMEVARVFNPEVPDFSSIKNMLVSLLHRLEDRILSSASETVGELWQKIEPVVMLIRMTIEMLKEIARQLKTDIHDLLAEYRALLGAVGRRLENTSLNAAHTRGNTTIPDSIPSHANADKVLKRLSMPDPTPYIYSDWQGLANDLNKQLGLSLTVGSLQTWGKETLDDLYQTVSPAAWEIRLEQVFGRLEQEFKTDLKSVTSLFSKAGARKLVADFDGTLNHLFDKADVTDYLKIIRTAATEVAIPDPNLYFDSLLNKLDLRNKVGEEQLSKVWDIVKRRVLTPIIDYLKQQLTDALYELVDVFIEKLLAQKDGPMQQTRDMINVAKQLQQGHGTTPVTLTAPATEALKKVKVVLNSESVAYLKWMSWVVPQVIRLSTRSLKLSDVVRFIQDFYGKMPADAKKYFYDLLPNLPSDGFTDYVKNMGYTLDLETKFFCATLLNLKGDAGGRDVDFQAAAVLQICLFVGDNDKGKPALFVIPVISAKAGVQFTIGSHLLTLTFDGKMGEVVKEAMTEPNVEFNVDYDKAYQECIERLETKC